MVYVKAKGNIEGKGMYLGINNNNHYYLWKYMGKIDIPLELALKLLKESPQRVELVDSSILDDVPVNVTVTEVPKTEDVVIPVNEIDAIKGFGPETVKDVIALFYLVQNVHTIKDLIRVFKSGGHIPLSNNTATKLKAWLIERYPAL